MARPHHAPNSADRCLATEPSRSKTPWCGTLSTSSSNSSEAHRSTPHARDALDKPRSFTDADRPGHGCARRERSMAASALSRCSGPAEIAGHIRLSVHRAGGGGRPCESDFRANRLLTKFLRTAVHSEDPPDATWCIPLMQRHLADCSRRIRARLSVLGPGPERGGSSTLPARTYSDQRFRACGSPRDRTGRCARNEFLTKPLEK